MSLSLYNSKQLTTSKGEGNPPYSAQSFYTVVTSYVAECYNAVFQTGPDAPEGVRDAAGPGGVDPLPGGDQGPVLLPRRHTAL